MADIDTSYLDSDADKVKPARSALLQAVQRINDLSSAASASKGAGMIGFDEGLAYPDGTVGARLIDAASGDTDDTVIQGREYATPFLNGLIDSMPQKIIMSGDSTTNGDTAVIGGRPWEILPQILRHRGVWADFEVVNAGHSGHGTAQWLSTHLAADLAASPSVYILRWGLNDLPGLSAASTVANVASGLATIRASHTPQDLVVVLMSPNSCDDDEAGRTAEWNRAVSRGLRDLARTYQCVYIDTGRYLQDATIGVWINEDYEPGSSRYVHPLTTGNQLICTLIADALFSEGVAKHLGRSNVTNQAYPAGEKLATDPLDTYDYGLSICPATTGFPYQGVVHTIKQASSFGYQVNWPAAGSDNLFATRLWLGSSWTGWAYGGATAAQSLTLTNGWVDYGVGDTPYVRKASGIVYLGGLIKSGTTTNGTQIATLPAGHRPVRAGFFAAPSDNSIAQVHIDTAGAVTIYNVTSSAYLSIEGISFVAA